LRQGFLYKKLHQYEEAVDCFKKSETYEGYIELAKWAEHIAKRPDVAYDYTEQARKMLEQHQLLSSRRERLITELNHRSLRLQRKCQQ
jgi:hypothetical protein